jgi:hypothetical protein
MSLYKTLQKQVVSNLVEASTNAQIVQIKSNYVNLNELCLTSVTLIPANIAKEIIDTLVQPL